MPVRIKDIVKLRGRSTKDFGVNKFHDSFLQQKSIFSTKSN